ncbi:helix-turn-helix domain-containing protein [Clostridium felsineum]|uniref:helix-turn-helix domain-containing protein n=1 Tax=Clostridium felsineum TaxID=36839 RepID=UPI00098BF0E8|nr:helix-turn-helix domain-containing protein [Clostridium felsineum]URZ18014.1 HTH-type transcriptional activator RhaR [Clostridium felsineum DSM 794]
MFLEANDIDFICKTMFDVLKIPVYFISNNKAISSAYYHKDNLNPFIKDQDNLFENLFSEDTLSNYPIIKSTKYKENYFAVNLKLNNSFIGKFIVGPSLYLKMNDKAINIVISENNLPISSKLKLVDFYNNLTIMNYPHLVNTSILFYYCIYRKKLKSSTVIKKNSNIIIKNITNNLSSRKHHSFTYERNIFKNIEEGNVKKLLEYIDIPPEGDYGLLADNYLRNEKNLVICSITLATRSAIAGGLSSELAYSLSDSYIQRVEQLNDINTLLNLKNSMFIDFSKKVYTIKQLKYPKPIVFCKYYISNHIYDNISLKLLSTKANLSPKYLSELFSKNVGMTLTDYIHQEKIKEAKFLLTSTNYNILDISNLLNFHDQSHFTRIFKKFTGITPKHYRDTKNS